MSAHDNSDSRESESSETWSDYALARSTRTPVMPVLYASTLMRCGDDANDLVIYNRNGSIREWIQSDTYGVPAR